MEKTSLSEKILTIDDSLKPEMNKGYKTDL